MSNIGHKSDLINDFKRRIIYIYRASLPSVIFSSNRKIQTNIVIETNF